MSQGWAGLQQGTVQENARIFDLFISEVIYQLLLVMALGQLPCLTN